MFFQNVVDVWCVNAKGGGLVPLGPPGSPPMTTEAVISIFRIANMSIMTAGLILGSTVKRHRSVITPRSAKRRIQPSVLTFHSVVVSVYT